MNQTKDKFLGFGALLLAAMIFASFGIYIRVLSQELSSFQQIFFRGILGFAIAIVFIIIFSRNWSLPKIPRIKLVGYALVYSIAVIFLTLGVLRAKIATTIFGIYTGTLVCSFFIGLKFFGEKLTLTKKVSLSTALIGLLAYTFPLTKDGFSLGLIFAVTGGVLDSVANALRKDLTNKIDRLTLVAIQLLGLAIVSLPFVFFSLDTGLPQISITSWLVGLWYGLMLVAVNFLLLYGFARFDLNLGSIVLSSELFFASIIGLLVFGERLKLSEIIGGLLLLVAMAIASLDLDKLFKTKTKLK